MVTLLCMMCVTEGGKLMQIEIKIDESIREKRVVIMTSQMDEEVRELMNRLIPDQPQVVAGFREGCVTLLEQRDIIRIYASSGKVIASTANGEYHLRMRLYELEERLDKRIFVRISNSEIVNLRSVKGFDLSYTGTIRVSLCNGQSTFVSRRYVARIKKVLGI